MDKKEKYDEKYWEHIRKVYRLIDGYIKVNFGDNDKPIMDLVEKINEVYDEK